MTKLTPTAEQAKAIEMAATGKSLAIEALAGTGKTSTLTLIGAALAPRKGCYIAFNKAIVVEAQRKFGDNITCSTAHSLAFRSVGKFYRARMDAPRMRTHQLASFLGTDPLKVPFAGSTKRLSAGFIATQVSKALRNFSLSADEAPTRYHVPKVEGLDDDAQWAVKNHVAAYLPRAWADIARTDGRLPFTHDYYLKLWQLTNPRIAADFILFDEAQDANPVMLSIVEQQADHAQLIFVGDTYQQIYSWRGAQNAMATAPVENRTWLTQSFRFGQAVADTANLVLNRLAAPVQVVGNPALASTVGYVTDPDVLLCRKNATVISGAMKLIAEGKRPAIVGGADEILSFARAALNLQNGKTTDHPQLCAFDDWDEVAAYLEGPHDDDDLARMVKVIDEFGAEEIIDKLQSCTDESKADRVFSTAHKAKGREWSTVRLADDFAEIDKMGEEDLRLLYVAVTRAINRLEADLVYSEELDLDPAPAVIDPAPAAPVAPTGETAEQIKARRDRDRYQLMIDHRIRTRREVPAEWWALAELNPVGYTPELVGFP